MNILSPISFGLNPFEGCKSKANHPRLSNVAMTTKVTPKFDNKNGNGNKNINQINMLILVRLKPLTDGNIGIFANEYSSLR